MSYLVIQTLKDRKMGNKVTIPDLSLTGDILWAFLQSWHNNKMSVTCFVTNTTGVLCTQIDPFQPCLTALFINILGRELSRAGGLLTCSSMESAYLVTGITALCCRLQWYSKRIMIQSWMEIKKLDTCTQIWICGVTLPCKSNRLSEPPQKWQGSLQTCSATIWKKAGYTLDGPPLHHRAICLLSQDKTSPPDRGFGSNKTKKTTCVYVRVFLVSCHSLPRNLDDSKTCSPEDYWLDRDTHTHLFLCWQTEYISWKHAYMSNTPWAELPGAQPSSDQHVFPAVDTHCCLKPPFSWESFKPCLSPYVPCALEGRSSVCQFPFCDSDISSQPLDCKWKLVVERAAVRAHHGEAGDLLQPGLFFALRRLIRLT